MPDRNSTQIRQALEAAVDWAYSYDDHMSQEEANQRDADVAKAKAILQGWREQEEAEAVGAND